MIPFQHDRWRVDMEVCTQTNWGITSSVYSLVIPKFIYNRERVKSMRCIAAPIIDSSDNVIATVGVSGPTNRMHSKRFENEIPQQVLSTANIIEVTMTYS
ncbi:IclR family transcriptional regulator domain-containing protein [Halocatena marina]